MWKNIFFPFAHMYPACVCNYPVGETYVNFEVIELLKNVRRIGDSKKIPTIVYWIVCDYRN